MTYLVDANVLSEATRPAPNTGVVSWLRRNEADLAVDPIIVGEIRFGIYLLPPGRRRRRLERWFADGVKRVRCFPWELATGLRWAKLLADLRLAPVSSLLWFSLRLPLSASRSPSTVPTGSNTWNSRPGWRNRYAM